MNGQGPLLISPELLNEFDFVESYDADGGAVSVPNTNVYTTLTSLTPGEPFLLQSVAVGGFDPVVQQGFWTLRINGLTVFPWIDQRIIGPVLVAFAVIHRLVRPFDLITVEARIPAVVPAAVDFIGRITGARLRRR